MYDGIVSKRIKNNNQKILRFLVKKEKEEGVN